MSDEATGQRAGGGLFDSVLDAYNCAKIEPGADEDARKAVYQATEYTRQWLCERRPHVSVSDDGTVTLQWRRGGRGVLLIFTGDNTACYSLKPPGGFYATNGASVPIGRELPDDVMAAIEEIERG